MKKGTLISQNVYVDLVPDRVSKLSQVVNLMTRTQSLPDEEITNSPLSTSPESYIESAIDYFGSYITDNDNSRNVKFMIEQLQLPSKNEYHRNYSPERIKVAYLINSTSAVANKVLREQNVLLSAICCAL